MTNKEIEVKFRVQDLDSVKSKLSSLGLNSDGEKLQKSIAFDNKILGVRDKNQLVRLREEDKVILTFKDKKESHKDLAVREEIEVTFDDFDKMKLILERLGFEEFFIYEKYRETFKGDGFEIVIDRVPFIRYYMEIEANEEKIYELIKKLELDMKDSTTSNYRVIFEDFCKKNNLDIKNMTFEEEKRLK